MCLTTTITTATTTTTTNTNTTTTTYFQLLLIRLGDLNLCCRLKELPVTESTVSKH